ncbi:multicopper oxidase family protein [Kitasatospora acidiphila]|uniref:multicopper oxidase family protein n=1 Tax=Kitasatospora acidiphila TaxID=2567942 RepID=UPI0015F0711F|nr:multicopper oxidase domain-containing protein [Kitasatospora acidiphila]
MRMRTIGIGLLVTVASLAATTPEALGAVREISQTPLPGDCVPRFATALPVFGPAGSTPRVDAARHRDLTVTMAETDQAVLPQGRHDTCGLGVTFGKTRVWAYETSDTVSKQVLGPANWPAVTIDAKGGVPTRVTYANKLPSFDPSHPYGPGLVQDLVKVDQTVHWANPLGTPGAGHPMDCSASENANNPVCQRYTGPQPAVPHLHGAEISACYDGGPDAWFTPDGRKGPQYCSDGDPRPGTAVYTYQNSQEPGTLWFHDHTLGATRNNVYGGLAGFYLLRQPSEEPKGLPSGPYEIEMALQDRVFDTHSQLLTIPPSNPHYHPYWGVREFGDVATVNGAAWPYLDVQPRRYRFRLLNGANGRRFSLHFGGAPVYQIGADDAYFDRPVRVNDTACAGGASTTECSDVDFMPGERADIIVDFTKLAGKTITVTNDGSLDTSLPNIMQFRVGEQLNGPDSSCDPARPDRDRGICSRPTPVVRLAGPDGRPRVKVDKARQFVLNELNTSSTEPEGGNIEEYLNNTPYDGLESPGIRKEFPKDGISELPVVGSTELWQFINAEDPAQAYHPIHTHLVQFQIVSRQNIDYTKYEKAWSAGYPTSCKPSGVDFCPGFGPPNPYRIPNDDRAVGGNPAVSPFLDGAPQPPDPGETGWKDTVRSFPHEVLTVLVRFAPTGVPLHRSKPGRNLFPFDPTVGQYVWHCHVLGHEDNEMMRPYRVVNGRHHDHDWEERLRR